MIYTLGTLELANISVLFTYRFRNISVSIGVVPDSEEVVVECGSKMGYHCSSVMHKNDVVSYICDASTNARKFDEEILADWD
jgi:hypothetical protein